MKCKCGRKIKPSIYSNNLVCEVCEKKIQKQNRELNWTNGQIGM